MRRSHVDLRCLDVAQSELDTDQAQRAYDLLERIVGTSRMDLATSGQGASRTRSRPRRIWLPIVGTLVAALLVTGPLYLGGPAAAYASWTQTPGPVDAVGLRAVVTACRHKLRSYTQGAGRIDFDPAAIPVVLAERRGDYVAVLLGTADRRTSAACVATNRSGSTDVPDVGTSVGSTSGPRTPAPPNRIMEDSIAQFGSPGPAAFVVGAVGSNVVGVIIHAGDRAVNATVNGGTFFAWWPGKAFQSNARQNGGHGGPKEILSYDLELADGTTATRVMPWYPPPAGSS